MSHASDAGDRGRALRLQRQDVLFLQPALSGAIQSQSGAVPTPRQIGNEGFEIPNFKCDLHVPHASGSPPDGTWCVSKVRNGARAGNGDPGGGDESGTYRYDAAILDCRGIERARFYPWDVGDASYSSIDSGDSRRPLGRLAFVPARLGIAGESQPNHVHTDRDGHGHRLPLQHNRLILTLSPWEQPAASRAG